MTAYEFLSQGRRIDDRIERKKEEIERLRSRLTKATAQLTGMPRGGSGGDWTDADVKLLELEGVIAAEIKQLCTVKRQIIEAISAVQDTRYRDLLEMRYRNNYTFEKIAVTMNYDWRHIMRMHKEALEVVKVPDNYD